MDLNIAYHYHKYDLPNGVKLKGDLAIDTEAMGLNNHRDRLCVIQISEGNGDAHIIHFPKPIFEAPNLKKLISDKNKIKIFHFGRFDIAIIQHYLVVDIVNVFCTKIASRLCRTFTDLHGLKELCNDLLGIKISKQQQTSDWGAADLSPEQLIYAASDVLYLHQLRIKLNDMLERENRIKYAQACFDFLPTRAKLDTLGWADFDIFQH